MCGIFCSISCHGVSHPSEPTTVFLKNRGPDSLDTRMVETGNTRIKFLSTVLSLRGSTVVSQPLVDDESGSILCWNGEAWKVRGQVVEGNDSFQILELLLHASTTAANAESRHGNIIEALNSIRGPFAMVFFDAIGKKLYFGRDCIGRRSLAKTVRPNGEVIISSICDVELASDWSEVESGGLYVISLPRDDIEAPNSNPFPILEIPFHYPEDGTNLQDALIYPYPRLCTRVDHYPGLLLDQNSDSVVLLEELLSHSLLLRIQNLPGTTSSQTLAILFSGGLDSSLLALMSHKLLPPNTSIDLLNVAFQNPRIHKNTTEDPYSICPDRITGQSAYKTLKILCPDRQFRFICINIPFTETSAHRATILSLMQPHNTEMDLSIASALYFASRGCGYLSSNNSGERLEQVVYTTPSRVLLSGLGADEIFGGYARHAMAFQRHGYAALLDQLELDFNRLGQRNLGRDDRVTSHWGREVRYPFLDEDLLSWAMQAPIWEKCGFGSPSNAMRPGEEPNLEPGKLILRLLAWKLGMQEVAKEKKRAIQFGSRTAKMHTGKTKGTELLS